MYKVIDMSDSPRKAEFDVYAKAPYPYCTLTVDVDVTDLHKAIQEKGKSFNVAMNHAVAKAADEIPEFRRRLSSGTVKEYDHCITSHVELTESGEMRYCKLGHELPVAEYFAYAEAKISEVKESPKLVISDTEDMYFTSCIPWISYTQALPAATGESNPRFLWGGFKETCGRIVMPFTVQVHHALVDGYSMALFYAKLEKQMEEITKEILEAF